MFPQRNKIIYFAPHQDDELLTMGVDICRNARKGHEVHVVLCTDGSKSNMRLVVGNGKACSKHEGLHLYNLSVEAFIQARDREFTGSCLALGVKPENIHIAPTRDIDGSLTQSNAQKIVRYYLDRLGADALVCTHSPLSGPKQHRDHRTLGQAVDSLLKQGVIRKAKFFVEPYHYSYVEANPRPLPGYPERISASASVKEQVRQAIGSYSRWDPEHGRYAVGYHSVTTEFNDFLENSCAYFYTKVNEQAMSTGERRHQQYRKWVALQKQKQLYYSMAPCGKPDLGPWKLVQVRAGEADAYRSFCRKHDYPFRDKDLQRITDGSSFWCLTDGEDQVVSTGWLAYKQAFYIGETDYGFDMARSQAAILFDFNTRPEFRGRGCYGLLLRSIASRAEGPDRYIIYTSPVNEASSRGILKAGFQFEGAFCAEDHTMKQYLNRAGFTSIYRKYQFRGLRVRP